MGSKTEGALLLMLDRYQIDYEVRTPTVPQCGALTTAC